MHLTAIWMASETSSVQRAQCVRRLVFVLISSSVTSLKRWCLFTLDVKAAFLQAGTAERDIYVIPSKVGSITGKWLSPSLGTLMVWSMQNATWHVISDDILGDKSFSCLPKARQLFSTGARKTIAVLSKIVDDILMCRKMGLVEVVIENI